MQEVQNLLETIDDQDPSQQSSEPQQLNESFEETISEPTDEMEVEVKSSRKRKSAKVEIMEVSN